MLQSNTQTNRRSSLIEYIEGDLLEPISTEIEFNLIGENHHMKNLFPPDRGHKCISLLYPNPEHVQSILKKMKGPSLLYLRGCAHLLYPHSFFSFENFKTLTALEISGATHLTGLPHEISEMTQLQSLNLSHLPIHKFPTDHFFSNLTNIRFLVLKACPNLHSLPNFSNLTALVLLDLSHLLIEALPDGVFSNMKKLRKLILRGCSKLHILPCFKPLKNLEFLDISYTILHLTTGLLAHNFALTHVFGRYTKGSVYDSLVDQSQIEVLALSGAQHLGRTFQLRKCPPFLKALDISKTSIESIDCQSPPNLFSILLIRNCSNLVELSAMKNLKCLTVLNMSGCESLCVLPEDLCELVMLQELNLSGCTSLTELREGTFDQMKWLQKLDLSKTNFKHLPSFAKLISLRTHLILPRGLVVKVPELSSYIKSKNLSNVVIVEDDVASPDLESEDQEGSIPNEFHLVSTFTNNTDLSFNRFKHEFKRVKDLIFDIQSKIEANLIVPKGSGTILVDLEYILENIDLLESADHEGKARKLLERLMDVVDYHKAGDSNSLKGILRLVVKLKLLFPCPKKEDFNSKMMKNDGIDSDDDVSRLYRDLQMLGNQTFFNSYNSLTKAQRSCLLYFSIFTMKSTYIEIKQRTLIQLWYGEGFIDDARHEQNVAFSSADTIDEIGRRIMLILQEMRFIKRSNNSGACVMDNGVHCLLRRKAKEEGFIDLNDQNYKLTPQLTSSSERACLLNSRYNSPSSSQIWLNYSNTCQKAECFKNIRTLFNVNECIVDLRGKWFSKMRNLYVLHLGTWERQNNMKNIEIVDLSCLEELKNMKQLKVLSLEGVVAITKLPDSVCQLTHLEMLNLRECGQMEEIPDDIVSLQNLSHLDVTNCPLLSMLPKGIMLLSKLEVLRGFLITYDADVQQNKKACTLADLVKLEKLRKLNLVVNLTKFPSNEDLQVFKRMNNLCNLKITWLQNHHTDIETQDVIRRKASRKSRWQHLKCWEQQTAKNDEMEESIMRCRFALEKLKKLVLCCFPLETAPEWLHPNELHNLEKLYIIGGHLKTMPGDPIHNTWNVKTLHLKYALKLDKHWERLRQIFPNISNYDLYKEVTMERLPHHLHVDYLGEWNDDQCR